MRQGLDRLRPGEKGRVLALPQGQRGNLRRLGLIPGTEITCLRRSPLGDPSAYRFRGTTVALRRCDAARIVMEVQKTAPEGCT